jgi:hypothetical protein
MLRRIARIAVLVVTAAAALVSVAGPAAADTSITTCANGAITQYTGLDDTRIELAAWMQPCAGTNPAPYFGITAFTSTSGIYDAPWPFVADRHKPTFIKPLITSIAAQPVSAYTAICLAYSTTGKVSCLAVGGGNGVTIALKPIPTTDPLVALPTRQGSAGPDPTCGTCV